MCPSDSMVPSNVEVENVAFKYFNPVFLCHVKYKVVLYYLLCCMS